MKWINVNDRLPTIPKGKYGTTVLVAVFDPADSSYEITTTNYGTVIGKKQPKSQLSSQPSRRPSFSALDNGKVVSLQ